jgi:hypothetical protein
MLGVLGMTDVLGLPAMRFVAPGLFWAYGHRLLETCPEIERAESPMLLSLGPAPDPDAWHERLSPVLDPGSLRERILRRLGLDQPVAVFPNLSSCAHGRRSAAAPARAPLRYIRSEVPKIAFDPASRDRLELDPPAESHLADPSTPDPRVDARRWIRNGPSPRTRGSRACPPPVPRAITTRQSVVARIVVATASSVHRRSVHERVECLRECIHLGLDRLNDA